MNPITIFRGTSGLNTVDDPVMIKHDKDGFIDMTAAADVTIERSGRPMTRKGLSILQSGSFHGLFCDSGDMFVVKEDSLYQVAEDGFLAGVRSGLTLGQRMDFAQAGNRTYYVNGFELGYIQGGVSYVWSKSVYTGPDSTREFSGPIPGNHLEHFAGRMFISQDNVLWWSELYDFGLYDQAEGFLQFRSKILFLCSVDTGLFLSTENNTYYLTFNNTGLLIPQKKLPYPGVEWSEAKSDISPTEIGIDAQGVVVGWASREGAVIGCSGGFVENKNRKKIIYPDTAKEGFGVFAGYHFIHGIR